ncbi:MAG: aminotransferase class I/II-fold pyridoxal phosphate-dependent enzyme [Bacteroidota bacterium]
MTKALDYLTHWSDQQYLERNATKLEAQESGLINLSEDYPLGIKEVGELWEQVTGELMRSVDFGEVLCRYGSSQGYRPLIDAVIRDFKINCNLELTEEQILITPGIQSLYFYAFHALAGNSTDKNFQDILLPLALDYRLYNSVENFPQRLNFLEPTGEVGFDGHSFRYRLNFEQLQLNSASGGIFLYHPCNSAVSTELLKDVEKLVQLSTPLNIPIFITSPYHIAHLQPHIFSTFSDRPSNLIHCFSFSESGLTGERLGVVIGSEEVIQALGSFQTNLCIHAPRFAQAIAAKAISSEMLRKIYDDFIRPYYQEKFAFLKAGLERFMPKDAPWFLHTSSESFRAWLWLKDLSISSSSFCKALRDMGLITIPSEYFFPGNRQQLSSVQHCIPISLALSESKTVEVAKILSQFTQNVYHS